MKAIPIEHFQFLGFKVRDKITGFEGVGTALSFDLYGCVQTVITPTAVNGEMKDARWFDNNRLEIISNERVMRLPNFALELEERDEKGGAEKPAFSQLSAK